MNLKGRRRRRSPMKGMPRDRSGTRKTPAVTQRFASCKGNGDRFSVGWFWAPFSDHPCPTTTNPRTQGWNNVAALLAQATGDRQKKSSSHTCAHRIGADFRSLLNWRKETLDDRRLIRDRGFATETIGISLLVTFYTFYFPNRVIS